MTQITATKRKRQAKRPVRYPIGSVSSRTMQEEDLIPTFAAELEHLAKQTGIVGAKRRREHLKLVSAIETRMNGSTNPLDAEDAEELEGNPYFESDAAQEDLESLFDALEEYSGPYFYFGAHCGDGSDYGWWLSEDWDSDFVPESQLDAPVVAYDCCGRAHESQHHQTATTQLKVSDLAGVPKWFRGEVVVVSDHGNVSLYVKTARGMRVIWEVV